MPEQTTRPAVPPAETPSKTHGLVLENRARLVLSGVSRIVSCDETGALLKTALGDVTVGGQGIQIGELSVRTGQVQITGRIDFIQYAENRESSGGLLARLFR